MIPLHRFIILYTGEFWSQKAHGTSDNRGKQLRRDGFTLAEERYGTCAFLFSLQGTQCFPSSFVPVAAYKLILDEVEKILAEAGLDEEEMRKSAAAGSPVAGVGVVQSRNRR